jgi:hypothetical protein
MRKRRAAEPDFEEPLLRLLLEKSKGPAIAIVWRDDDVSGLEKLRQERQSRHAGRSHHGAGAALKFGKRIGKRITRRVAGSRVIVLPLLTETREREIRREMQRRYNSTVLCV